MMTIEERKKELEKVEERLFILEMKDKWTAEDLVLRYELVKKQRQLYWGEI